MNINLDTFSLYIIYVFKLFCSSTVLNINLYFNTSSNL